MNNRGARPLSSSEKAYENIAVGSRARSRTAYSTEPRPSGSGVFGRADFSAELTPPLRAEWRLPSGQSLIEFALSARPPATCSAQAVRKPALRGGLARD
jgi:hypothetical protein